MQELTGGAPSANILSGLDADEWFTRIDGAGPRYFLIDGLGSSLALADGAGTIQTAYSYEPFGGTVVNGAGTNPFQFTGRENDGTGLYEYRARYYSPVFQRFISEDPVGLGGGDTNFYAYVGNDPTDLTDPSGLTWESNWNYLWDWAIGRGGENNTRSYGPNDIETKEMQSFAVG